MAEQKTPVKRRRRWILRIALALVTLIALVVILAPTLINLGLGRGFIQSPIARAINGTVDLGELHLGWFGTQGVTGFTITDPSGSQAAKIDVALEPGLWKLLWSRQDGVTVKLTGTLDGRLRSDGTVSFTDLIAKAPSGGSAPPTAPKPKDEAIKLEGVPPVTLVIENMTINLFDEVRKETFTLSRVNGELSLIPGSDTTCELKAVGNMGSQYGDMELSLRASNLLDADGTLAPDGASLHLDMHAREFPLPLTTTARVVRSFVVTMKSDDLSRDLGLIANADIELEGAGEPLVSRVGTSMNAVNPFTRSFAPSIGIDTLTGEVRARTIPASLVQPFLSATPIVLARDVGDLVELQADFGAGATKQVSIFASGEHATLKAEAVVDPKDGAVTGRSATLSARIHPDLMRETAALHVGEPVAVNAELTSFSIPPRELGKPMDIRLVGVAGTARIDNAFAPARGANEEPIVRLEPGTEVRFAATTLGEGLHVEGQAVADGGTVTFSEDLTRLFDTAGKLAVADVLPVGRIEVKNMPASSVAKFMAEPRSAIVDHVLTGRINATAVTSAVQGKVQAQVDLATDTTTAALTAMRTPAGIEVASSTATVQLTPELVAKLQEAPPAASGEAAAPRRPIRLTAATPLTITPEPLTLPREGDGYAMPKEPVRMAVRSPALALADVPSLVEDVNIDALAGTIIAMLGEAPRYDVEATAVVRRPEVTKPAANAKLTARMEKKGETSTPSGTLVLTNLAVPQLEKLLGRPKGDLSQWLGEEGSLTTELDGADGAYVAAVKVDMPNLAGDFNARLDDEFVSISGSTTRVTLAKETLEARLNPPADAKAAKAEQAEAADGEGAGGGPASGPAGRTLVMADVPLKLDISAARMPLAMLSSAAFDPKTFNLGMTVTGGPVALKHPDGTESALNDIALGASSQDLAKGIGFTLKARPTVKLAARANEPATEGSAALGNASAAPSAAGTVEAGMLDVTGVVEKLVSAESIFTPEAMQLQMTARANKVPTALADAMVNMQGLLVAAVGNEMNATFIANNFSATTGDLKSDIQTTNGFLKGTVRGRNNTLRLPKDVPVTAELALTKPLRDRLLEKVHPIFADVRTVKNPIRVNIPMAVVPADGDVAKLRADLTIEVGEVELDSGSALLKGLSLFSQQRDVIPGYIETVKATIRNGIVKYEQFSMKIDKFTLVYEGEIDLVKERVELRTKVPLAALAQTFKELEGYADKITVPLVTKGKFGTLKTEIDPDFDVGKAAVEAGFKGALDDAVKGDLLKGILDKFSK